MTKRKWYQNPEMVVAFAALFVSLVTTVIGVYSAYTDRTYARASVWPRIEIYNSFGDSIFSYSVTNNGTGPALIKQVIISHNSKPIKNWRDIKELTYFVQSQIGNRILPSLATIMPLKVEGKGSSIMKKQNEFITIEICYCSIYQECWVTDRTNQPKEIEFCKVNEEDAFLQ
ncbi:MAG: hypothetical protein COA86_12050 [Kangiella sp.]|nr:MAG: hypothetical protein COA86_12050 [Kangiella sp.]